MATKIQIRRGTAASWTSTNPTLSSGELGLETDTNKVKIGDGATAWNSLSYFYDQSALSQANASATYLSIINASATYIPLTSQQTIINTASAAAVAYADGLTTSDVAEGTNLYFTNQRAIDAASATYILQTNQQGIINSASAAAVIAVLDGAPGALDTLNELAAALNDDASFATTVTNSLAAKLDASSASSTYLTQSSASITYAPIASPTFTGTVTIPTLDLTNALAIVDGGTGATTATAAANAILPSQASNSGKYLTTDGTNTSWGTVTGGGGTASDDTIFKAQLFFGGSN